MPRGTAAAETKSAGRAGWGTISRQQIIDAALNAIRRGGYEQMTIRSLAGDMGVAPMSLYRHVRDKDDLLDEVVDRLLVRAWQPRAELRDWRAWVVEAADKLRHFLVAQPAALHVYLRHPVVSPAAVARMEAMMAVLRQALGDEASARRAYAALHTYTVGFATLEASRFGWNASETVRAATVDRDTNASRRERPRSSPEAEQLAEQLAAYTTPRQFGDGLQYLLDGIVAGARSTTTNDPSQTDDGATIT